MVSASQRDLVALIPRWLAVTRCSDVATGLSREEALGRARLLRRLLAEGKVSPQTVFDEDLKDVLHALVVLVTELEPEVAHRRTEELNTIYQFFRDLRWQVDDLHEKRDLMLSLAQAGWRATEPASAPGDSDHNSGPTLRWRRARLLGTVSDIQRALRVCTDHCREETLARSLLGAADGSASDPQRPTARGLMALLSYMWARVDRHSATVAAEAATARRWIASQECGDLLFDELDYFLGEFALLAARGFRFSLYAEAHVLSRAAEDSFAKTCRPELDVARARYIDATVRYEERQTVGMLERLQSLAAVFGRLGALEELVKCRLVEAMCLKRSGRTEEAIVVLKPLSLKQEGIGPGLSGHVLAELADDYVIEERYLEAKECCEMALPLLEEGGRLCVLAQLRGVIGEVCRKTGRIDEALAIYREVRSAYSALEMCSYAAYYSVVIAETLMALGREREAEEEIVEALPTIQEQKMIPEAFAAVALLRESVRRQKTDPDALRKLREHLQRQQ